MILIFPGTIRFPSNMLINLRNRMKNGQDLKMLYSKFKATDSLILIAISIHAILMYLSLADQLIQASVFLLGSCASRLMILHLPKGYNLQDQQDLAMEMHLQKMKMVQKLCNYKDNENDPNKDIFKKSLYQKIIKKLYYIINNQHIQMVLKIGLISLILINKKQKSHKTRLQKLASRLKNKPLTQFQFYELPIKKIIMLLFIFGFIIGLGYLEEDIKGWNDDYHKNQDLNINSYGKEYRIDEKSDRNSNINRIYQKLNQTNIINDESNKAQISEQLQINQNSLKKEGTFIQKGQRKLQLQVMNSLLCIKYIRYLHILLLFLILVSLQFSSIQITQDKRIKICKLIVSSLSLSRSCFNNQKKEENINIRIFCRGQDRFTNYNEYYSIQVIDKSKRFMVCRRGDIFSARKTLIQICNVLQIKPDLAICFDGQSTKA